MSHRTVATATHIGRDVPWEVARPLIIERIKRQVLLLPNGCWEFTGFIGSLGYGDITVQGKGWRAHRLAYTVFKGHIPNGMHVLHTCDHRPCMNPEHLWLGTHLDNQKDMLSKGRNPLASRTHCIRGHDYLILGKKRADGSRVCMECDRITSRDGPKFHISATHCRRGHEYTPESTYVNPDGRRRCKICQYAAQAKRVYCVELNRPSP